MLETVFSKELLYPSLRDLRDAYIPWLDTHGADLAPSDRQRYMAQHTNITAICRLYEASDNPDSRTILGLVNEVGTC